MGKGFRSWGVALLMVMFGGRTMAQGQPLAPAGDPLLAPAPATMPAPPPAQAPAPSTPSTVSYPLAVTPTHLSLGDQQYDPSVEGLRSYLATIKTTNPQLYGQLAPDLDSLESKATAARISLIAGVTVAAVALTYGLLGKKDCRSPSIDDPNFAKDVDAWSACNQDNMRFDTEFSLLGLGALIAGGVTWMVLRPNRTDLFAFVSKHNQLSRQPLHFELGYDPGRHLSYAGATLRF